MTTTAERLNRPAIQREPAIDRGALRLSASLLVTGEVVSLLAGIFHPAREAANNHPAVFAEYAGSSIWIGVHLGQFVGMAFIVGGLLTLVPALRLASGAAEVIGRLGVCGAAVALALYGVLQAVDGVALKRAVDAWASAPVADKAARFANAEAIRWLEEAVRSYQSFVFGLTLVLLAGVTMATARSLRGVGFLVGLSGLAYIVQGWLLGTSGFSTSLSIPQLLGYASVIIGSIWMLVVAWRMSGAGFEEAR